MENRVLMIDGRNLSFSYDFDGRASAALDGVHIDVREGEMIAVLGRNGSGKSTLARHFNALLPLQTGTLTVAGVNAGDEDEVWRLRRLCGMVFQNPDNQFVSSVIEEDVAFGLENYETPRAHIPGKVAAALKLVDMTGYEKRAPHTLSGGQKQRVALAGVLATAPEVVILDEVTAMLDPEGRAEILDIVHGLHRAGRTIVLITHYVEEAVDADRVYLMQEGKILARGAAREILTSRDLMEKAGLVPPVPTRLYYDLRAAGITLQNCPLTNEELVEEICRLR